MCVRASVFAGLLFLSTHSNATAIYCRQEATRLADSYSTALSTKLQYTSDEWSKTQVTACLSIASNIPNYKANYPWLQSVDTDEINTSMILQKAINTSLWIHKKEPNATNNVVQIHNNYRDHLQAMDSSVGQPIKHCLENGAENASLDLKRQITAALAAQADFNNCNWGMNDILNGNSP